MEFAYEKKLWKKGHIVGGCDEVGRGSLSGPVVAACVVFAPPIKLGNIVIDDSKKLSGKQRDAASVWIKENTFVWGVGEASVGLINKLGIVKATRIAFRKAIAKCKPDFLLIDAFYIPYVRGLRRKNQKAIIRGDSKSISIAAASIIAKVYRDEIMISLGRKLKYRKYGWEANKGYGTKEHQNAIKKYGITKFHRKGYVKNFL